MLRTKPVGPAVISCLAALLLAPMARAQMPVETITAHVDSLDTMLQQAARSSELRSSSLKVTDRYLQTYLRRHTEVSEMLRINSKGKVTSEVVRTGKPGQRYRSVATQG